MTIDELITVLQAAKEGKPCQEGYSDCEENWFPFNVEQWVKTIHVRVKPEPRRVWVNYYPPSIHGNCFATEQEAKCDRGIGGITVEFLEVTKP